jgi:hypothetical protein
VSAVEAADKAYDGILTVGSDFSSSFDPSTGELEPLSRRVSVSLLEDGPALLSNILMRSVCRVFVIIADDSSSSLSSK